ncbi:MAG: hypothetical protein ACOCVF_03255 [bacterium]
MDVNKILKQINEMPEQVRNYIYSAMISASLGMSKVEKQVLSSNPDETYSGDGVEEEQIQNKFLSGFKKGIKNEQYVKYFYQVLEKADQIITESDGMLLESLADKHGMNVNQKNKVKFNNNYNSNSRKSNDVEIHKTNIKHLKDIYNPRSSTYYDIKAIGPDEVRLDKYIENVIVKYVGLASSPNRYIEITINPKEFNITDKKTFNLLTNLNYLYIKDKYGKPFFYSINTYQNQKIEVGKQILNFLGEKIEDLN